jgi:coenzyme PQQ precursor peptide PqqA
LVDAARTAQVTTSHRQPAVRGILSRRGCSLTALRRGPTLRVTKIGSREVAMKWKTPVIIEIAVGLEINAYACAEVK